MTTATAATTTTTTTTTKQNNYNSTQGSDLKLRVYLDSSHRCWNFVLNDRWTL